MVAAISPNEIGAKKASVLPDHVLETWNTLLAQKSTGGTVRISQQEAIVALLSNCGEAIDRATVFERGWLDIEPVFRAAGWRVHYDKPGYCESYEPSFTFKPNS